MATMNDAFVDCETIRLKPIPGRVTVWEFAAILDEEKYHFQIQPHYRDHWFRLRRRITDPKALEVGSFGARFDSRLYGQRPGTALVLSHPTRQIGALVCPHDFALELSTTLGGAAMWGSNPAFDMAHLAELIRIQRDYDGRRMDPGWHYHPNDIPSVARGWCAAKGIVPVSAKGDGRIRSDDWSRAIGVNPNAYDRHSALGDCRWVKAQHDLMLGGAR